MACDVMTCNVMACDVMTCDVMTCVLPSSGETVGFAVPRRSGGYVAGVGRSIVAVDWSTRLMTTLVEVDEDKKNNRLNDGKVDPTGRLLAGESGYLSGYLSVNLSGYLFNRYNGEGGATC